MNKFWLKSFLMTNLCATFLSASFLHGELQHNLPLFTISPLHMEFNAGNLGSYFSKNKVILDNPICYGIIHHKMIEMILVSHEHKSENEIKTTTKRVVVEPYAFGLMLNLNPIIAGNIVEEKITKVVTTKYIQEPMEEVFKSLPVSSSRGDTDEIIKEIPGFFSNWFSSDKTVIQNINVKDLIDVKVLDERTFTPHKDFQGFTDKSIKIICSSDVE